MHFFRAKLIVLTSTTLCCETMFTQVLSLLQVESLVRVSKMLRLVGSARQTL